MKLGWYGLCAMAAALLAGNGVVSGQRETNAPRTTEVQGDHLDQSVRCNGRGVVITGNDSRLSVLGPCTEVRVAGSRNWISVGAADSIVTTGDRNTVEYTERRTRVSDRGRANSVAEKYPQ